MSQAGIAGSGGGGGGSNIQTITGDSGGPVGPDAAHNIDMLGNLDLDFIGTPGTNSFEVKNLTKLSPYVVGPLHEYAYQTIQSAIDAAVLASGGTIYVTEGTYTENLIFSGNNSINIIGIRAVTITGTHSVSGNVPVSMIDCNLSSAGDIFTSAAVLGTSSLTCSGCGINCNGFIYNLPQWIPISNFNLIDCNDFNSTANGIINNLGGGAVTITRCSFTAGGITFPIAGPGVLTDSTFGGNIDFQGSRYSGFNCSFEMPITFEVGSIGTFRECQFLAPGVGPAITNNSGVNVIEIYDSTIDCFTSPAIGGTGTLKYAGLIFLDNTVIANTLILDPANWRPYATDGNSVSAVRGTAGFDSTQFIVTNGFVEANGSGIGQTITGDSGGPLNPTAGNWNILGRSGSKTAGSGSTLTVNSPPFADQGGSTTVTLNSGSFATAAITLTTPATAGLLDGDLLQFVATNGVLVIQFAATQVGHIGTIATSVAGTFTSTATGDSVTLRYQASTNDWWATSVIGTWVGA